MAHGAIKQASPAVRDALNWCAAFPAGRAFAVEGIKAGCFEICAGFAGGLVGGPRADDALFSDAALRERFACLGDALEFFPAQAGDFAQRVDAGNQQNVCTQVVAQARDDVLIEQGISYQAAGKKLKALGDMRGCHVAAQHFGA